MKNAKLEDYTIRVRRLSKDDGGGYLAEVVEMPGCMSDGETPEEAMTNVRGAFEAWTAAQARLKKPIPGPIRVPTVEASGQFRLRLPRSLHAELALRAEDDGVSLNTLVVSLLSRRVGSGASTASKRPSLPKPGRKSAKATAPTARRPGASPR